MRLLALTVTIIFLSLSHLHAQNTISSEQFYNWMSVDSDTVDYRWFDIVYIKQMNQIAVANYRSDPTGKFSPYLFSYSVHAARYLNMNKTNRDVIDSIMFRIHEFEKITKKKDAFYYNSNSYCYNSVYFMYMAINDLDAANQALTKSQTSLERAYSIVEPGTKLHNSILYKLIGLYNNKAILLYKTTHHLDSEKKRNEAGPIMIDLLETADSLGDIALQQIKIDKLMASRLITVNVNKFLIYGGYWTDSLKAAQDLSKAKSLLIQFCSDTTDFSCLLTESHIKSSLYWVRFARNDYARTITLGRAFYEYLQENRNVFENAPRVNSFKSDVLFALTDSYMKMGNTDSAYYFGALFLRDTLSVKDYSFMSEISSIMAELSLEKNIEKAKEYLQLSKDCIRRSKSEQVRSKIVREGEISQLNRAFERILEVQGSIQNREERDTKFLIILLFILTGACLAVSIYIFQKIRHRRTLRP